MDTSICTYAFFAISVSLKNGCEIRYNCNNVYVMFAMFIYLALLTYDIDYIFLRLSTHSLANKSNLVC